MRWTRRAKSGLWEYESHKWFAWWPVRVATYADGRTDWAWLTYVSRKRMESRDETWWDYI